MSVAAEPRDRVQVTAMVLPGGRRVLSGGAPSPHFAEASSSPGLVALALAMGEGPDSGRCALGARLAVKAALALLKRALDTPGAVDTEGLRRRLLWTWRRQVKLHHQLVERASSVEAAAVAHDGAHDRCLGAFDTALVAVAFARGRLIHLHLGADRLTVSPALAPPMALEPLATDAAPIASGAEPGGMAAEDALSRLGARVYEIETPRLLMLASDAVARVAPDLAEAALSEGGDGWRAQTLALPERLTENLTPDTGDLSLALAVWPLPPASPPLPSMRSPSP